MEEAQDLSAHLDRLERINQMMKHVFATRAEGWKPEMVRLRRVQSEHLSTVAECLARWGDAKLSPDDKVEALRLFTKMRHSISLTQSEWPLSLLKDAAALAKYSAASRQTIQASDTFFAWIGAKLVDPGV